MRCTDLELFMTSLKQLIYNNTNPLIETNRFIKAQKPQLQLLYEELGFLTRTCFIDIIDMDQEIQLELEEVRHLKKRIRDVAATAEDIVDLFVSAAILEKESLGREYAHVLDCSLDLKAVMIEVKSIKDEIRVEKRKSTAACSINNDVRNMFQFPLRKEIKEKEKVEQMVLQATGTSSTANVSAGVQDEIIVGLDEDVRKIVERLTGDRKQLDIISIVGTGGLGKTTLATKVYNDPFVLYHFHVHAWITVSQAYEKRDLLLGILESICKVEFEEIVEWKDNKLPEMLYKRLKEKRYLIVIDDIWSTQAWDDLRLCFPNDNTGSRILLTSRLAEVASYAKPGGFTHSLRHLTDMESWELLHRKVFGVGYFPRWSIEPGLCIASKCMGLPLALVVVAGLLAKEEKNQSLWENVAENVSSFIVNNEQGCLDTLALSYDHLPHHLRDCFLYVGGFPEDYEIPVKRLIWLWVAEGFIKEAGQRSLEEVAEDYLMDLVDRSLIIVANRRAIGGVKACRLHDLLRELCLKKAIEENFFRRTWCDSSPKLERHIFTNSLTSPEITSHSSAPHMHTFMSFHSGHRVLYEVGWYSQSFQLFLLLRVLDLGTAEVGIVPPGIALLVHLRYLAIWVKNRLSSSICNLWNLQTLILTGNSDFSRVILLPNNMGKMVNLRHLWSKRIISFDQVGKPLDPGVFFNLQTISVLELRGGVDTLLRSFPNIKKLACTAYTERKGYLLIDFSLLSHLENLKMLFIKRPVMRFPEAVKKIVLKGCHCPWNDMSEIQRLPNLEVLELLDDAFIGCQWDTGEQEFCKLKHLKLQNLNIQKWVATRLNFPCLRRLELLKCRDLNGIPLGIGDIPTLEIIEIDDRSPSVVDCVNRIREDQHAMGNFELKINVNRSMKVFSERNQYIN